MPTYESGAALLREASSLGDADGRGFSAPLMAKALSGFFSREM